MDEAKKRIATPEGGTPTRVTPGVPPAVAPHTETVRESDETRGQAGAPESGDDHQQDVKEQAQHKAGEVKDRAEEKVKQVRHAAPEQVRQAISTIQGKAREDPLPFAVGGGLLAGFLLGWITRRS
jgi:ElaB/YqjD/DUF883 family membrane-anchored ribosome-binding protein